MPTLLSHQYCIETERGYLSGLQEEIPAAWVDASGTHHPPGFQPPCYLAHNRRDHQTHRDRNHQRLCLQTPEQTVSFITFLELSDKKRCVCVCMLQKQQTDSVKKAVNHINELETVTGNKETSSCLCTCSAGLNPAQTGNNHRALSKKFFSWWNEETRHVSQRST